MKVLLGIVLLFPGVLFTLWGHTLVDLLQTIVVTQDRYADSKVGYSLIRLVGIAFLALAISLLAGLI